MALEELAWRGASSRGTSYGASLLVPRLAATTRTALGARRARAGFNGGVGLAVCNRRRFSLHRATPAPPRHAPAAVYVTGVAFSPFSSVVAVLVAVGLGHARPLGRASPTARYTAP